MVWYSRLFKNLLIHTVEGFKIHIVESFSVVSEAEAGIKTARKNSHYLRYADDTTLMEESEEELKSLLMKVKEES